MIPSNFIQYKTFKAHLKLLKNVTKLLLVILLATFIQCSYYSPTGIKGSVAKKELETLTTTSSASSLTSLISSASSLQSTSSVTCTSSNGVSGSTSASSPTSFTLPINNTSTSTSDFISSSSNTTYFLSSQTTSSAFYSIKSVIGSPSCAYEASTSICSDTNLSDNSFSSSISSTVSVITLISTQCIAIKCTSSTGTIRLRADLSATSATQAVSTLTSSSLTSTLTNSTIGASSYPIEDDKYYTKSSFETCKNNILLLQTISQNAISTKLSNIKNYVSCLTSLTTTTSTDSLSDFSSLFQGSLCPMVEEKTMGF